MYCCLLSIVCFISILSYGESFGNNFKTLFAWNYINFTWACGEKLDRLNYKPDQYVPVGMKIYIPTRQIFLALPRFHAKARLTLASVSLDARTNNPLLEPYPSWAMNTDPSCDALHDVTNMEIDRNGVMWVLDAKRTTEEVTCPPKLVLLDLKNKGKVLQSIEIPEDMCSHKGCFLSDIVVDGDFGYFVDSSNADPGFVVYNRKQNMIWKARDNVTCAGLPPGNINWITLSPPSTTNRTLYINPQESSHLYTICTSVLKDYNLAMGDLSKHIKHDVKKLRISGSTVGDSKGDVYFALIDASAVAVRKEERSFISVSLVETNEVLMKHPGALAFDQIGGLYVFSLGNMYYNKVGLDEKIINFRILKMNTGTKSYLYGDARYRDSDSSED